VCLATIGAGPVAVVRMCSYGTCRVLPGATHALVVTISGCPGGEATIRALGQARHGVPARQGGSSTIPGGLGGADTGAGDLGGTGAGDLTGTETTAAGGPGDVRDETGDLRRSGPKPDTNPVRLPDGGVVWPAVSRPRSARDDVGWFGYGGQLIAEADHSDVE
jgi:hypothetical protein